MKPILLAAWIAAFGGDMASTNVALRQGAREVTLPTQRPFVINMVLTTEAVGGYFAYKQLRKSHPKFAKVLFISAVAAHGTAAVWNFRQLR